MKDIVKDKDGFVSRNGILTKYRGSMGDVVIPDDIIGLGAYAFKGWGEKNHVDHRFGQRDKNRITSV